MLTGALNALFALIGMHINFWKLLRKCKIVEENTEIKHFTFMKAKYDINKFVSLKATSLMGYSLEELKESFEYKKRKYSKSKHKGLDNAILHSYRIAIEEKSKEQE